ncbi:spore germination protein [Fredinandcohnia sp. QZ13]|uniref:spore germination protein n=1 Tax=Fredinandcohnia sp. QZ13 TaxID=3073144 RepID=UPI0028533D3F|nr:spore germination protein [Fredinandcohnia sp. QZ13]MDR4889845.1 spore germination protein [Fredinandcohnia sp. QZ13]
MPSFFKKNERHEQEVSFPENAILELKHENISGDVEQTVEEFKQIYENDIDFSTRRFHLFGETLSVVLYMSSLVDQEKLDRDIIKPLQETRLSQDYIPSKLSANSLTSGLLEDVLYHCSGTSESRLSTLLSGLLRGKCVVLIEGSDQALFLDAFKPEKRSLEQPETERVVRGPRDGFIEQIMTNVSLLRYRLPVPEFRIEQIEVGRRTKTRVGICYIEGIVNKELLNEVKKRLDRIDIDRILDAGYIEQFIEDNPRSPFPQVQSTERPDKAVGNLLEGRIVLIVDGSPFVLIVPATFNQFYQTSEDYNERFLITSAIRLIRFMALIFSLTFSSFYVTVLSYHPEMIPAKFVVAASSGRSGVPFPVFIEVFLMEVAMEILREATVRMPQQVGGALSIVGVLVIGQAAVLAGFASPITVVIIALSTIGSFATPSYNAATAFRMLRFPLIILAGTFGLLGLAFGVIFILNHMLSLRSFGLPYMAPIAPGNFTGMKDSFIRAPLRWLKNRPAEIKPQDVKRMDPKEERIPKSSLNGQEDGDSNG